MQRYFINGTLQKAITLNEASIIHHALHVMRMKKDDKLIVCNEEALCSEYKVVSIQSDALLCEEIRSLKAKPKKVHVTLAQSLIRKERFELVLQKATELGADSIIPLETARSIIKLDSKGKNQKHARWETIIKEASEQSHRFDVPELFIPKPLKALDLSVYDKILIPYEKSTNLSFKAHLETLKENTKVLIIIGPEGGFTEEEIDYVTRSGGHSVSLGARILRAETAALYAMASVSLLTEMSEEV